MGTVKDSVYLQERIEAEEKRLAVLEDRRTNPDTAATYEPRGAAVDVLVPSFLRPDDLFYIVSLTQETLTKVCGGFTAADIKKIGCLAVADLPAGAAKVTNKYNTGKYPKVQIIHGLPTPTAQITEWGTRWIKSYAKNGNQSHRLIPFGYDTTSTTKTVEEIVEFFDDQFGVGGPLHNVLGVNGSASLIFGKSGIVATHEGT